MVAKPGGIGENKIIQIGSIFPSPQFYQKTGDTVLSTLKAVYNGESSRVGKSIRRILDYGTPSK